MFSKHLALMQCLTQMFNGQMFCKGRLSRMNATYAYSYRLLLPEGTIRARAR